MRFTRPSAVSTVAVIASIEAVPRKGPARFWSARFPSKSTELLSKILKAKGIKHNRPERKVPRAARPRSWHRPASSGAVTVATNMAGRGTDIMLGGNAEYHGRWTNLRKCPVTTDEDHAPKGQPDYARCTRQQSTT